MKDPVPTEQPPPPALCYSFESLKLKVPKQGFVDPWVGRRPLLSNAFAPFPTLPYSSFRTSSPFLPPTPDYSQYVCLYAQSLITCIFLKANPGLCKKQMYWKIK